MAVKADRLVEVLDERAKNFLTHAARLAQQPDEAAALKLLLTTLLLGLGNHYRRPAMSKALGDLWVEAYINSERARQAKAEGRSEEDVAFEEALPRTEGEVAAPSKGENIYRHGPGWRARVTDPKTGKLRFLQTARTPQEAAKIRDEWVRNNGLLRSPWDKHLEECRHFITTDYQNADILRRFGDAYVTHLAWNIAVEENIEGRPAEKPADALEVERILTAEWQAEEAANRRTKK